MNADMRKKNRLDFLQEGSQLRKSMESERLKLEVIKNEKLESLKKIGVPEKYTVDLASKRFN